MAASPHGDTLTSANPATTAADATIICWRRLKIHALGLGPLRCQGLRPVPPRTTADYVKSGRARLVLVGR